MSVNINVHYDEIYRYCFLKVRNLHTAEDLTQETFLKFIKQNNYIDLDKPLAYLYTIARNTCFDYLRKAQTVSLDMLENEISADNELCDIDTKNTVREAVFSLPVEEQELVFLRYVNCLSIGDIAKVTQLSRFAIYRRLKKSMDSLSKILKKEDFYE